MKKISIDLTNQFADELKKLIIFATSLGTSKESKSKLDRYRALALGAIRLDPLSVLETVGSKLFENKEILQQGRLDLVMTETLDKKYKDQLEEDKFTAGIVGTIKEVYQVTTEENKALIMTNTLELLDIYIQYLISLK